MFGFLAFLVLLYSLDTRGISFGKLTESYLTSNINRNSIFSLVAEPNRNGSKNSGVADDERKKIMTTEVLNDNNIATLLEKDRSNLEMEQNKDEAVDHNLNPMNGKYHLKDQFDKISEDDSRKKNKSNKPAKAETATPLQAEKREGLPKDLTAITKNNLIEEDVGSYSKSMMIPSSYLFASFYGNRLKDLNHKSHLEVKDNHDKENKPDCFKAEDNSKDVVWIGRSNSKEAENPKKESVMREVSSWNCAKDDRPNPQLYRDKCPRIAKRRSVLSSNLSETKRREREEDAFKRGAISNPSVPKNASRRRMTYFDIFD